MNVKKLVGCMLALGLCAMALTGCGQQAAYRQVPVQELVQGIEGQVEFSMLGDMDAEQAQIAYEGLPWDQVEAYAIRYAMMNVRVNELAVFVLKDQAHAQAVMDACRARAEQLAKQFEQYLPDQYAIAQNPLIAQYGTYVLFAIHEDTEAIRTQFESMIAQ